MKPDHNKTLAVKIADALMINEIGDKSDYISIFTKCGERLGSFHRSTVVWIILSELDKFNKNKRK